MLTHAVFCRLLPLRDTLLCLLWCRKLYSKLGWRGGSPPVALHPSSLSPSLSLFFIYIYAFAPQASPKSIWFLLGLRSQHWESATSKLPPSILQRREESKEGGRRREKIWDKFCFTHTPQICLCSWKNCCAHLWCCVENPSISVPWPLHSRR